MAIREGKWRCPYCGEVNRGRDMACSSCAATRDDDVAFYLEDDAAEIVDEALLAEAIEEPEWICETCGTSNRARFEKCLQCGAPKGASKQHDVALDDTPEARGEAPPPPPAMAMAAPSTGARRLLGLPCGCLGAAAAGLIALVVVAAFLVLFLNRERDVELVVAGVSWQRDVHVEELKPIVEDAWEGQVPPGAREISRSRELHHTDREQVGSRRVQDGTREVQVGTKRVKVGTRSKGNGYFEDVYEDQPVYRSEPAYRDEPIYKETPVYAMKVRYQIEKWVAAGDPRAEGADASPRWPEVQEGPRRRIAKRTEKCVVSFRDAQSGKTYEHEVKAEELVLYPPGARCRAKVNLLGINSVDPPAS